MWIDEWIERWEREGLPEDEWPLDELPRTRESPNWTVVRAWRRTACQNRSRDSKIWVQAPAETYIRIEYEYGKGQAFDRPNIGGVVDDHGYLWWYNAKRTAGRMKVYVDGELLVENLRFDLRPEYCKPPGSPWFKGNRPTNKPGQFVYDIVVERKPDQL